MLVEDSVSEANSDLIAKHGLSFLIETDGEKDKLSILMDTGPSPDTIVHNADALGVDIGKISAVFLSHGHYDHTGGLMGVLRSSRRKTPVIAHPKIFDVKLKIGPSLRYIGSPFKQSEVDASNGVMLLARNPVVLTKGVMTSGEIERGVPYEKNENFWTVDEERSGKDAILDDQALIIDVEGRGLTIISGCAHSGIVNTLKQAQKVTGINKVYAILGGFHLKDADEKRIESTVKEFLKVDPEVVGPCHCTGFKAVRRLTEAFGDRCEILRTGDAIEL